MGLKWSRSMNMMENQLKNMVRAERFLIKHNLIKPTTEDDKEDQIRVEYFIPFNESIEMQLGIYKAISGSPARVASEGFNMIASVMRVEIPKKIDDVIKSYLNT